MYYGHHFGRLQSAADRALDEMFCFLSRWVGAGLAEIIGARDDLSHRFGLPMANGFVDPLAVAPRVLRRRRVVDLRWDGASQAGALAVDRDDSDCSAQIPHAPAALPGLSRQMIR